MAEKLIHASCIAIGGKAVPIAGAPGTGKSDLALRLIDEGASLVADDQTLLRLRAGDSALVATAPPNIAGLIEVRHVGLLRMPCEKSAPVALYVELAEASENLGRLPEENFIDLLGVKVRRLKLPAFAASTPAKIRAALRYPLAENSKPNSL